MYVCLCHAVTDHEVEGAIDRGADTVAEVTSACGAGRDCGACHRMIEGMLDGNECRRRRLPLSPPKRAA